MTLFPRYALSLHRARITACNCALRGLLVLAAVLLFSAGAAQAQDRRQNRPGQFDFYVLSLSWSPSFCEAAEERSPGRAPQQQCGSRPFSFVVHGLWPQYDRGFPEFCQVPAPRLNRQIMTSMLDLMPAPRLIFNEWDKHGTCSGLGARGYFDAIRKARAAVKIPDEYLDPTKPRQVVPSQVVDAFVKANPGMTRASISISCDTKRLNEVRVCLSRELGFRDCPEVANRACRRDKLVMPAIRGG
jgi:ribonuclease T2